LQEQGCEEWYQYANWTDYVFCLFGMKKEAAVVERKGVSGRLMKLRV
jgi:hypothetical protein